MNNPTPPAEASDLTGKLVTLVRVKGRETFTIQAHVTEWRLHPTGQVGAVRLTGHRTEDGRRVLNQWYSVGPDALDGSQVSYQRVILDDCGHPLAARCACGPADTSQLRWVVQVRQALNRLRLDPDEVEAANEGFGQDFFVWRNDPVGFAHEAAQLFREASGACRCGCCGPDSDCACGPDCCNCNTEEDPQS